MIVFQFGQLALELAKFRVGQKPVFTKLRVVEQDRLFLILRLLRTIKDTVECVVILRGHRVELVAVTAGTVDREAHGTPGYHVDAVIDDILGFLVVPSAKGE